MDKHQTIETPYFDKYIEVDRGIQPLLVELWAAGIKTMFSCEGRPLFKDQTHWDAKRYRAYVMMERTTTSVRFVADLLCELEVFMDDQVSWTIEFDRNPDTDENRITIKFPTQDIDALITYVSKWS